MTGCDKRSCKSKIEKKGTEIVDETNTPPGIGFSFAMCDLSLSRETDGFQLLVDSGSSKHFIDLEFIRRVEPRMLQHTRIEPLIETRAAGNNVLHGTVQGIVLVVVLGTNDVLRTVKLPIMLVPGLKKNLFSSLAAAQIVVKTIFGKNDSFLDLGLLSVQLL